MRTTLVIDDGVMKKLKALAAQRGHTLSRLVESLLRKGIEEAGGGVPSKPPGKIPTFSMGRARINIANRGELYRAMEEQS